MKGCKLDIARREKASPRRLPIAQRTANQLPAYVPIKQSIQA